MSDQTYTDPRDGSTLRVEPLRKGTRLKEDLLRFVGTEDSDYTTVDLNRESVKALVEQANKWLEDTEVKLPTTLGSVLTVKGHGPIVDGEYHLMNKSGTRWRAISHVPEKVWMKTESGWDTEEALTGYLNAGTATIVRDAAQGA